MQLRITHALIDEPDGGRPLAVIGERLDGSFERLLVPGTLPCGECARCRRALAVLCPRATRPFADGGNSLPVEMDVAERFCAPIDPLLGRSPMDAGSALAAFLVARLLDAAGRIGLGPGDVAIWMGSDAQTAAGATLAAARGSRSFRLSAGAAAAVGSGVVDMFMDQGLAGWQQALAAAEAQSPGGFQERKVFVGNDDPDSIAAALALAGDGGAVALMQGSSPVTIQPAELPLVRLLVHRGPHPDLLPEALASVARGDVDAQALIEPLAETPGEPNRLFKRRRG